MNSKHSSNQAIVTTVQATDFQTYEAYLDSHVNETDRFYLENIDTIRGVIELGMLLDIINFKNNRL